MEIKELQQLDIDALADDDLTEAVVVLGRLGTQLSAAHDRLLSTWDRRGAWRATGAQTAAAGLASFTSEPKGECGSRLWLQRTLRHLPLVDEALLAGDITVAHARLLARARNPRTAVALVRDQAMLLDAAMHVSFADFGRVVDYWTLHTDPDGADATDIERGDARPR